MNIIRQGDPDKIHRYQLGTKLFICDVCDCIFEANCVEYKIFSSRFDDTTVYTCHCPCCNNEIIKEKYVL